MVDLPYYRRPIEMTLIDPMHNVFLGAAKHFARNIWITKNIIDNDKLLQIEIRLRNAVVPLGIGRLPVTVSPGIILTAEQ